MRLAYRRRRGWRWWWLACAFCPCAAARAAGTGLNETSFVRGMRRAFPDARAMTALYLDPWLAESSIETLLWQTFRRTILATPKPKGPPREALCAIALRFDPAAEFEGDFAALHPEGVDVLVVQLGTAEVSKAVGVLFYVFDAWFWPAVVIVGRGLELRVALRDLPWQGGGRPRLLGGHAQEFGLLASCCRLDPPDFVQRIQGRWIFLSDSLPPCLPTWVVDGIEVRSSLFGVGEISGYMLASDSGGDTHRVGVTFPEHGEFEMLFSLRWHRFSLHAVVDAVPLAAVAVREATLTSLLDYELPEEAAASNIGIRAVSNPWPPAWLGSTEGVPVAVEALVRSTPDKFEQFATVSHRFKRDFARHFAGAGDSTVLEVGGHHGYTSRLLSHLFGRVIVAEKAVENIAASRRVNSDRANIFWVHMDAYTSSWARLRANAIHVVFIDALHDYASVVSDIYNSMGLPDVRALVFDDYGLPHFDDGVRAAVDHMVALGYLRCHTGLGHEAGTRFLESMSHEYVELNSREGVVCDVVRKLPVYPMLDTVWLIYRRKRSVGDGAAHSTLDLRCMDDAWFFAEHPGHAPENSSGAVILMAGGTVARYTLVAPEDEGRQWIIEGNGANFALKLGPHLGAFHATSALFGSEASFVGIKAETLWEVAVSRRPEGFFCKACSVSGRVSEAGWQVKLLVQRLPEWQTTETRERAGGLLEGSRSVP